MKSFAYAALLIVILAASWATVVGASEPRAGSAADLAIRAAS